MKHLEIISVRTSGISEQQAYVYIRTFCRKLEDPLLSGTSLYINANVPGEFTVILAWQASPSIEDKTDVGFSLAYALKQFGRVEHVFWIMIES